MVRPFDTSYDGDNQTIASRTQTASAPPMEGDFDNTSNLVEFILLGDRENFSIIADKSAILSSKSQLNKIFEGGGCNGVRQVDSNRFAVTEPNRSNFELFIRYLETDFIKFENTRHTLDMLEIASRYRCPDFEIRCVKELDMNLSIKSVLPVFHALWLYNQIIPPQKIKDFKEKSRQKTNCITPVFTPEEYFAALLNNCLQLIEMHAEEIFQQEEIDRLTFKELEMIVKRDALQLTSEKTLYDLLVRWSREECLRKNLDITSENRRRVLGALCYSPRYLIMSFNEFKSLRQIELLDESEQSLINDAFKNKKQSSLTPEQQELLNSFKRPRPPFPLLPIQLSGRSNAKNYPKKMRRYVTELEKENEPKRNCCHKAVLTCVTAFAYIFD